MLGIDQVVNAENCSSGSNHTRNISSRLNHVLPHLGGDDERENVVLSARNIPGVKTTISSIISVYDILNADKFIIDKDAVAKIEEVYAE